MRAIEDDLREQLGLEVSIQGMKVVLADVLEDPLIDVEARNPQLRCRVRDGRNTPAEKPRRVEEPEVQGDPG